MRSILFIGAAHIDQLSTSTAKAVTGASNPGTHFEVVGGAALNSACIASAHGAEVSLFSMMGNDLSAQYIGKTLQQRGVPAHLHTTDKHATGRYTALLDADGTLLYAVSDLTVYDEFSNLKETKIAPALAGSNIAFMDANLPPQFLKALVKAAKASNVFLAATTVSQAKAKRLAPFADQIDLLFTNTAEAAVLSNTLDQGRHHEAAIQAKALNDQGFRNAVVTSGSDNLAMLTGATFTELPTEPTKVIDTTGAGDALAGATLATLVADKKFESGQNSAQAIDIMTLENAVKTGIHAASIVLQVKGPYTDTF